MSRKKTTWDRLKLCFLISWVFLNTKQSLVLALSMIQNTSRRLLQDNRSGKTSKDKMSSDTFCLLQWFMIYHDHSLCCSFWVPFQFNNPLKTFGLKINSPFFQSNLFNRTFLISSTLAEIGFLAWSFLPAFSLIQRGERVKGYLLWPEILTAISQVYIVLKKIPHWKQWYHVVHQISQCAWEKKKYVAMYSWSPLWGYHHSGWI